MTMAEYLQEIGAYAYIDVKTNSRAAKKCSAESYEINTISTV